MRCGTTGYSSLVNASTAPGVAAGSADPLLYVICDLEYDTMIRTPLATRRSVHPQDTKYLGWPPQASLDPINLC